MRSDCGHYTIEARLVSEQDGYTNDCWLTCKLYTGSHWVVTMKKDGQKVHYIMDTENCLCVHYGEYATGLCPYGMKLSKNTILHGAFLTGRFTKELEGLDPKKIEKQWTKDYVKARIAREKSNL